MNKPLLTIVLTVLTAFSAQAQSIEALDAARGRPSLATAEALMRTALPKVGEGTERSLQEARDLAQQARLIFASHGARDLAFSAARTIAVTYNDQNRSEESRRAAEAMFEDARRAKSPLWEASALAVMAFANLRLQNFEAAFLAAHQAYQIHSGDAIRRDPPLTQTFVPQERTFTCFVLGALYNSLGEPRTALVFLNEGSKTLSQAYPKTQFLIARETAAAFLGLGDHENATAYLETVLQEHPEIGGTTVAVVHSMLSDIALRVQQWETADTHAQRALAFARSSNNPTLVSDAYSRLGGLALARGDDRTAEGLFERASHQALRADRWMVGLGRVNERRGQLELARLRYEKAIESIEKRVLEPRSSEQDRVNLFRQRLLPYRLSVDVLLRMHFRSDDPDQTSARLAFQANQRIRNRLFVEQLSAAWNRTHRGPQEFESQLATVGGQIANISRTLLSERPSSDQQQNLRESLEKLEVEQSTIRKKLSIYEGLGRGGGSDAWSVERVQRLLPANTALVDYSLGEVPAVFVLTHDRFEVVGLPRPDRLPERIATYFDILSKHAAELFGSFEMTGGYELFAAVIHPALRTLPEVISQLIISTSGPFELLPFEALPMDRAGKFLIERYSISYLPSASALPLIDARRNQNKRRQLLAFADPAYPPASAPNSMRGFFEDDDFEVRPLPYTRSEVDSVSRIVGVKNADVFLGSEASESRLKMLDLAQYRVMHFATHAVASRSHPDRSALVFTLDLNQEDDGFLQVREIYDLRLNADLVVLSACQTGNVGGMPGEGIQGLARAFLFAGARSLVASMWKVEDAPTAALMTRFYRHLADGLSKTESLRRAKLDLIRQGAHPGHWASFVLFGEANEPVFSTSDSRSFDSYWYLVVVALMLVSLLIPLRKFRHAARVLNGDSAAARVRST